MLSMSLGSLVKCDAGRGGAAHAAPRIAARGLLKVTDLWTGAVASPFLLSPHLALQPPQLSWLRQAEASALAVALSRWPMSPEQRGPPLGFRRRLPAHWESSRRPRRGSRDLTLKRHSLRCLGASTPAPAPLWHGAPRAGGGRVPATCLVLPGGSGDLGRCRLCRWVTLGTSLCFPVLHVALGMGRVRLIPHPCWCGAISSTWAVQPQSWEGLFLFYPVPERAGWRFGQCRSRPGWIFPRLPSETSGV